jgi:hypothetical protein
MSQWDFGYGREPAEHHEPPYPEYPEQPPYSYPQEPQQPPQSYPQEAHYQYPEGPQPPPYPYSLPQPPPSSPYDADGYSAAGEYPVADGYPGVGEFQGVGPYPVVGAYTGVAEPDDPQAAPYPITYERDEFEGRASRPTAAPSCTPPYAPWPAAPDPADRFASDPSARQPWRPPPPVGAPDTADSTLAWYPGQQPHYPGDPAYRDPGRPDEPRARRARSRRHGREPWAQEDEAWQQGGEPWPQGRQPGRHSGERWPQDGEADWDDEEAGGPRRWLIPAGLALAGAAVGAAIVMFAFGHARAAAGIASPPTSGGSVAGAAAAASPTGGATITPLTLAAARSVLANYTTANNNANARRSARTLATIETGGSYAIDAGLYTIQAADGAAPYAAFTPVAATYYIPRAEPAVGPHWFVVQVSNAFSANPNKVTSTEYLLFTQAAAGGAWQNAVEPYLQAGGDAPQVAVGGDGLATAVSATATSLAVAPGQLAARTAAAIDGAGTGVTVADPGALADRSDELFWRGKLPTATVTDAHTAATGSAGQTFALLTNDGGALVFYTDAAEVAITPPAGSAIHLTVPGLYSPAQALSRADLGYLDQFAANDPPAGAGAPSVIAQYSGLTGKG